MAALTRVLSFLLLLGLLLAFSPEALCVNPGLVARITAKGLEYVAKEGRVALQTELRRIMLPDFTGDFKIKHVGRGHYEFHSLDIRSCELLGSTLTPLPGQGLSFSISDSFIQVRGKWKVRKSFLKLQGSFDLQVKGITISANLLLGSEPLGKPTVTASSCSSHIHDIEVDMSEGLGWLLNLFHNQIESKLQKLLENKICEMLQKSVTSDLQPYLQTLPITTEIDSFASIDYSLMEAPRATAQMLDVMLKAEIFNHDHRSPVAILAPVMSLPEEHDRMVYFAISDYVFNTASLVYHKAGYLNLSITDDMVPPTSTLRLTTKSFRGIIPRLARQYPNMKMELQGAVISAPFLNFSPGNLSLAPQMEIEAFVLLPSSGRESVFRLGVTANVSAILTFNASKITGFLKPEKVQVELKESKVGVINIELLEALLNYYVLYTFYPEINDKLEKGFPLPLLKRIQLYNPVFQIHKDFLFLGTDIQYMRV
ncbi:lipopolysaccharide-binding protein [Rousettus aegyptiacus]|uniref:Lipopolysaccharide-binding protein n=1 Tax=Rousettus aegyptiacus TaxID=9407 RepID=A0A7J8DHX0_ROUAE|nr:lipopolysaccharide-binding protein [Rousettus aegyptiacus]KAF6422599.1 lipopolysaccharide binding protein [Rousettus aegyptiacus]